MDKRVLIIDDEDHIRRMMRITLETAGYSVGEAADGYEGLKLFGDGSDWDGVVLDQRMPGMDGLEVLRRIKQTSPNSRVVFATAYASIELAVDAMKIGASDFVRKPMTPEVLRNAVAAALTREEPRKVPLGYSIKQTSEVSPVIETITMNGFAIRDLEQNERQVPGERRFEVGTPTGTKHDVLVQIDEQVIGYVERLTRQRLPAESSFWTEEARRLLSDYIWQQGEIPRSRRLTLSRISRDKLLIAERWRDE